MLSPNVFVVGASPPIVSGPEPLIDADSGVRYTAPIWKRRCGRTITPMTPPRPTPEPLAWAANADSVSLTEKLLMPTRRPAPTEKTSLTW